MSFSNAAMVRELSSLLNNLNEPTDLKIRNRIREVDGEIGLCLAGRYANPPRPNTYLTGTVSVIKDDKMITGSGTTFTNLKPGETIQVASTGEVLQILSIESDTLIEAASDAVNTSSGSSFWVVPDELVTASKWKSAHIVILLEFPEKTLKQDNVEKFDERMNMVAGKTIKLLESGNYINTDLVAQSSSKSFARNIHINVDNDNWERSDNNITTILGNDFH